MTVRLELMTPAYLDWLAELAGEDEIARFTRFPVPVPDGWVREWYQRYEAGRADGTKEAFIALDEADRPVGLALAPDIQVEGRELELGYLVDPACRGRGIATELLKQLTTWAFAQRGALRIQLMIDTLNVGSSKAAERNGYVLEGVLRSAYFKNGARTDVQLWSKLPTD